MRGSISKLALGLSILLSGVGVFVEAQEPTTPNPNTTQPKQTSAERQGRSNQKKTPATATEQGPSTMETSAQEPAQSQQRAVTDQTDLSGTYAGTFTCDEAGLTGDTTLTINGNQFTTSDGRTGRIVATTSQGYTAVAFQPENAGTGLSSVISLRAKKSGDRLTLTPVVGSTVKCSFVTSRSTASKRPSSRASEAVAAPAAAGTQVTNPAVVGPSPEDVNAPAPSKRSKSRRNTRATQPATPAPAARPAPATPPSPSTVPAESPHPVPAQTPSPTPTPSASPSPTESPSPTGSPSPTPTPTPKPSRG